MIKVQHILLGVATATFSPGIGSAAAGDATVATIRLDKPFATRTPWSLVVTQSATAGESGAGDAEPGVVTPCLRHLSTACDATLQGRLHPAIGDDYYGLPHYLRSARIVHRQAGNRAPILIVVLASEHAGNGSQTVLTQALAYDGRADRFARVFSAAVGTNNNEEVRFLESGPIRGNFVTVEPTSDAPYSYWVTVDAPTATGPYRRVLRYRSATHYDDGNPLPVIDSEMPQILRRLSLWRPGQTLPLPATPCPAPHLKAGALWCG